MKIGYEWIQSNNGIKFRVVNITANKIEFKSLDTGRHYEMDKKSFRSYIKDINSKNGQKTRDYKDRKESLKIKSRMLE